MEATYIYDAILWNWILYILSRLLETCWITQPDCLQAHKQLPLCSCCLKIGVFHCLFDEG